MKKAILICLCVCIAVGSGALGINFGVVLGTAGQITPSPTIEVDCALVLGCGILPDGSPTAMLKDRLLTACELYKSGKADILLMSGDNSRKDYNEVFSMRDFAIEQGVPAEKIFCDHAGFSTYESVYRAREIFCADSVIIVTQGYHLHRALFIANSLGVDAQGVSADRRGYSGQIFREIREILARNKDVLMCIAKPKPTFLGEQIPVNGAPQEYN